jgi:hypothetical protein
VRRNCLPQEISQSPSSAVQEPLCSSSISHSLAPIGEADFARLRRHSRRIAARNFCKSEIRLTGNLDCASAAAAYDANPPAAPPNARERDTLSALAGARCRPLGAAVAQSRACGKDQAANTRRKSGSPKLLTTLNNRNLRQTRVSNVNNDVSPGPNFIENDSKPSTPVSGCRQCARHAGT